MVGRTVAAGGMATAALAFSAIAQPDSNWMGLASGVVPLRVQADAAARVTLQQALQAIDGDLRVHSVTAPVAPASTLAYVYQLPAPTTFERFVVPTVLETPSPSQTFVRQIRILGSNTSADAGYEPMASGELTAHAGKGERTELPVRAPRPVRWVRVELSRGLDVRTPKVVLEFSELIGLGRQEPVPLSQRFSGRWAGRGLAVTLNQKGPLVSGCYDRGGTLDGTVVGNVLTATGVTQPDGVRSAFVSLVGADGSLLMLRSTNGAPFKLFEGAAAGAQAAGACPQPRAPAIGCGAVVHGIRFDFDSARLRPESAPVLDALQAGLAAASGSRVRIEGHTSSEGEADYNLRLSEQRAQAVVDALVQRGLPRNRLSASGAGEARPIVPNDDESGRALNRRVEVHCTS